MALSGSVTRQGAPLEQGFISLRPKAGHSGPAANADIRAGRYAFSRSDGPAPGPYEATINVAALGGKAVGSAPQVEGKQWRFDVLVPEAGEFDADFELEAP